VKVADIAEVEEKADENLERYGEKALSKTPERDVAVEEKADENLERTMETDSKKRNEESVWEKTNELENPERESVCVCGEKRMSGKTH
jgi:hypothetical protein